MEERRELPPVPLLPRSLSNFIAIANSEMKAPRERNLITMLLWASGISLLFASFPTPYRASFLAVGLVIPALIAAGSLLQIHLADSQEREESVLHLFRFLNYRRAKEGLGEAIAPEMVESLEVEAQIWEQIESALQAEHWKDQVELRNRIQHRADHAMVELIALGVSTGSLAQYRSWYEGWDTNSRRLRDLRMAVKQAERFLFAYARPSDLSAEVPADMVSDLFSLPGLLD